MDVSIVIPLYNEEESLRELMSWIDRVMQANQYSYETLFIDDGSDDSSWAVVRELCDLYPQRVRGIRFQRNYGKSPALYCGFAAAKGDIVVTMDADLQDSPEEIPEMRRMILEEGYDLVSGWKKNRHDPIGKTLPSKFFNATVRRATGIRLHDFNCGLKAYRRKVVKSIEVYGEMHRYIPVLARQAGFKKIGEKVVLHQARKYGVSKFGMERMVRGYLDLLSVLFITKFSKRPMHFFGLMGSIMFIFGFFAAAWLGIEKLMALHNGETAALITSRPYFYLALTLMVIGVQFFLAGYLGELISRSSSERNRYMIEEEF